MTLRTADDNADKVHDNNRDVEQEKCDQQKTEFAVDSDTAERKPKALPRMKRSTSGRWLLLTGDAKPGFEKSRAQASRNIFAKPKTQLWVVYKTRWFWVCIFAAKAPY